MNSAAYHVLQPILIYSGTDSLDRDAYEVGH